MRQMVAERVRAGTPKDLISAAGLGARIAARHHLAEGMEAEQVHTEVLARYRRELEDDGYEGPQLESLLGAVERAVDAVLADPGR